MPLRGYKNENPREWERLNKLLETAFKAEKDHRFMKLHQQKPIEDDWSRLYEYVPGEEEILQINVNIEEPKVVGHFGLYNQDMQYGKAILKNGGGRDVGTHPIVRGKGIGSLLAQDVRKFMRENKVDFSILFSGAGHFYEKNGWRGGMQV